jgi:hypothetical protein
MGCSYSSQVKESMDFSIKHDGLERTPWFPFARRIPERTGFYEIRPWKDAPDTRCEWRKSQWWTTTRLSHQLEVFEWRGITRTAYLNEVKRLNASRADA